MKFSCVFVPLFSTCIPFLFLCFSYSCIFPILCSKEALSLGKEKHSPFLKTAQFIKTVVTLWAIWAARRKAIHEDIFQSPLSVYFFIGNFLADLEIIHVRSQHPVSVQYNAPAPPRWIPPPQHMMKINVDAAVSRNDNRGVVAAICRSYDGTYQGSSVLACPGVFDPATLEALACREALSLAADLQLQHCLISSDCLEVVNAINKGGRPSYVSVLMEIHQRKRDFHEVRFTHEGRASNTHAHNLARNFIFVLNGRLVWLLNSPDTAFVPLSVE